MWKTVKLGDVVSYEKVNGQGSNRPYVGMEHISSETMELVSSLEIPEKTSSTFKFDERHVLFGRLRPYLRKVFVPDFDGQCSTEIFCLLPSDKVDKRFLAHWLLHPKVSTRINETSTGARMPRANMNAILDFDFPLPPLAEQQRIVAKLDATFAEIDKAIKLVETKQANAEKLKASLLDVSLTSDDALWKTVKLGDICSVITKGTTPTSVGFKFQDDGINFVKIESIDESGNFIKSKFAKISEDCHSSLKRSQLIEGDILFSIAGALGRTAVVTRNILPANTNQALAILRIKPEVEIDRKYLLYVLNSEATKEQSNANKGGVAQLNLSLSQLKTYSVSLPPLAEQQRIVAKLDAAFREIETVFSTTKIAIDNYTLLKSSLLARELNPSEAA